MCFDSGDDPLDVAGTVRKYAVGAESNVAVGLARLGHDVGYVGRVGADTLGREIVRTLRGEGVDVARLTTTDAAPTGILLKERLSSGQVEVTYHRAGAAGSTLDVSDLPPAMDDVAFLHVTGITLAISDSARRTALEAMRRARADGCRVSLDANFRRKLASPEHLVGWFEEAAPLADIVFLGRSEAAMCAGSDDEATIDAYARGLAADTVVVKGRRGGARAFAGGGRIDVAATPTVVVDPVGSGDGFVVGYLHATLTGGSLEHALAAGARVSERVIGRRGDYQGLPFASDLAERALDVAGVLR